MWLRWVVSNLLHQMAQEKVRDVVDRAKHLVEPAVRGKVAPGSPQVPESPELPPPDVVVMFALGLEAGGLVDQMTDVVTMKCPAFVERVGILGGKRFVVAESGVGREAAGRATEDVIKIHQPRWVVSAGFAGALVSDLHRGHMLMADSVMDEHRRPLEVGFRISRDDLAATPGLHVGRLLTVDQVIRHAAEKEALARQYEAVACDMETIAVAQACRRRRVRFLSVRIISESLDDTLPPEVERMLDQPNWAAKLGAATGAILHRPASVKVMWRLRETALRMSDRLAQFLTGMIPQLTAVSGDERTNGTG